MKIIKTKFRDLKIIKHDSFADKRGFLKFTYNKKIINWDNFIFDYLAYSKKNVFRGFHFQYRNQQAKLISVIKGKVLDCVVDLRKKSKTFGKYYKIIMSENKNISLYIPKGFAHGYFTLEKENIVICKQSNFYNPKFEDGIIWNDKSLRIKWPSTRPLLSKKDKDQQTLAEFKKKYKYL